MLCFSLSFNSLILQWVLKGCVVKEMETLVAYVSLLNNWCNYNPLYYRCNICTIYHVNNFANVLNIFSGRNVSCWFIVCSFFCSTVKNKYVELIFKFMLIHVYFRHAELWHLHPVIRYKCTNINIKSAVKSAYTERGCGPQSHRLVSFP